MANTAYTLAKANLNTVDWTTAGNKFRVLLATSSYTPSAAHQFVSDVTNEATGTGYARKLLGTRTRVVSGTAVLYKAPAISYTLLTTTYKYAIVYYDVDGSDGSDATAWLITALDMGSQSIVAALHTINFGGADPGAVFQIA